jgi:hypothetical protein
VRDAGGNPLNCVHRAHHRQAARIVKLLRVLRVVKLVKLRRASLLMRQLDYVLGPSLLQLLKLCLSAALLAHLIGCVFYVSQRKAPVALGMLSDAELALSCCAQLSTPPSASTECGTHQP